MTESRNTVYDVLITTQVRVEAESIGDARRIAAPCIASAPSARVVESVMKIKEAKR